MKHGTAAMYTKGGCRCGRCKAVYAADRAKRRATVGSPQWIDNRAYGYAMGEAAKWFREYAHDSWADWVAEGRERAHVKAEAEIIREQARVRAEFEHDVKSTTIRGEL